MGEGLSHWSSMVLRKSQTYFFDRHTHPNSMYSNFCHILNKRASNCSIIENIPPKGVIFSDFICTLAMSDEDL